MVVEGVELERHTKASIRLFVDENAVTALSSLVTCVEISWTPSRIVGAIAKVPTTREMRKNVVCSMILRTKEGLWKIPPSILYPGRSHLPLPSIEKLLLFAH